ncbi:MAG: type IV conjugative transfer system lipoprotein TraV [Tepidimonas ignava]|uniref:type IV conjugative transfer system lipoprotein TraV n=1 Tax=Tepidimonas ignava TaxID=114249 RepID=UPI003918A2F9
MKPLLWAAVLGGVLLSGCASTMSGLDGEAKFACKAPEGVSCASLSGVYANAVADNLPGLRKDKPAPTVAQQTPSPIQGRAPSSGEPIRTAPKVLRLWIAPWEDADGDLHDQSYVYVVANPGRWVIEHNQRRIIDRYRPTFIQPQAPQSKEAPKPQSSGNAVQTPAGTVILPGAQGYGPLPQTTDSE